ncbi:protein encore isoform X2 [Chrysoperla carnea]|uniref:protein encore isoform X2 n=1 Tax=Chrysoperla carnea TaxID=189513 RepID=UPI001D091C1B|nr:protein encore isoform X2 [Chrysoperla carnea]
MAKLEIPSIVVQSNCITNINMKKQSSLRAQRTLSKQAEFDEEEPIINISSSSDSSSIKQSEQKISIANDSDNSTTTDNAKQPLVNSCHGAMVTGAQRNRTNNKLKLLVRSQAIRESTSPPRDPRTCSQLSSPILIHSVTTSPELTTKTINNNNKNNTNLNIITPGVFDDDEDDVHYEVTSTTQIMQENLTKQFEPLNDDDLESYEDVETSTTIDDLDYDGSNAMAKYRSSPISNNNNNTSNNNNNNNNNNGVRTSSSVQISANNQRQKLEISTITISCQNCTTESDCCCTNDNINDDDDDDNDNGILERSNNNHNNSIAGNNNLSTTNNNYNNTLTVVNRTNNCNKNKLKHQNSSSFDSALAPSPCLSRDSSTEQYTDTTGINLGQFILETLNRNTKDRMLLLRIEQELVTLAKDKSKSHYKFPPMSSYQRMLVHRCAAFFGMDHNIEASGKCVIVNKTRNTRLPDIKFRDHIRDDLLFPEEPRRSILKRDSNSFEESCFKSPDRQLLSMENRRSKSFEEREEEYEKQMHDCSSQEELGWAEIPWSSTESDNSSRMRLLPPDHQTYRPTRLLKGQSVETRDTLRPCVSKSFSFGGYTGSVSLLSRGDSVTSTHSAGARLLTKQDSAASSSMSWRLSPSSSGYKSQSQRSDSVTPSPTATPYPSTHMTSSVDDNTNPPSVSMSWDESSSPQGQPQVNQGSVQNDGSVIQTSQQDYNNSNNNQQVVWTSYQNQQQSQRQMIWTTNRHAASPPEGHQDTPVQPANSSTDMTQTPIMWAITDLNKVPKGSYIINSETGAPFKNPDGTDYSFDPNNLHPGLVALVQSTQASLSQTNNGISQHNSQPSIEQHSGTTYYNQKMNISNHKNNTPKQSFHRTSTKQINSQTQGTTRPYAPQTVNNNNKQSPSPTSGANNNNNKPVAQQGNGKTIVNSKSVSPVKQSGGNVTNNGNSINNNSSNNTKTENGPQSPKKVTKYQQKPNNTTSIKPTPKTGFTNTATSPSLPFTPPIQGATQYPGSQAASYQYIPSSQYENVTNLSMQSFPVNYHSNVPIGTFGSSTMVPIQNSGTMQMYNEDSTPVYNYGVPQYNRMDSSVSELSGYFVNMNINNEVPGTPTNNAQPITYQSTNPYWGHQPMVCYVPPQPNPANQRYTVPLVQGQSGGYIQTYVPQQPSGPTTYSSTVTPGNSAPQSNTELVPIYPTGPPPSIVYGHPPPVVSNSTNLAITNHPPPTHPSTIVYAPTNPTPSNAIMYTPTAPPPQMYATPNIVYTSSTAGGNNNPHSNSTVYPSTNTPNSQYSTNSNFQNSASYNTHQQSQQSSSTSATPTITDKTNNFNRQQTKYNSFNKNNSTSSTRNSSSNHSNTTSSHSNQSSASSNSPASTVVQSYYHNNQTSGAGNGVQFNRHCSPSETPPSNIAYGYHHQFQQSYGPMPPPPHIISHQSAMIYRNNFQMGIRASPPINSRTSRSPTPGVEHFDRNTRYTMPPPVYQSVPCIIPGDMRFMSPRQQAPPYRNAYSRPSTFPQTVNDNTNVGRHSKVKKPRTKPTPPLPPSGR